MPEGFPLELLKLVESKVKFEDMKFLISHYFFTDEPIQATDSLDLLEKKLEQELIVGKDEQVLKRDDEEVKIFMEGELI